MANLPNWFFDQLNNIIVPNIKTDADNQFNQRVHNYLFDQSVIKQDHLTKLLIETPVFIQETTPRLPFVHNQGGHTHMHIHTRNLLYFLHKLGIHP